jgi:hypothetical protein
MHMAAGIELARVLRFGVNANCCAADLVHKRCCVGATLSHRLW